MLPFYKSYLVVVAAAAVPHQVVLVAVAVVPSVPLVAYSCQDGYPGHFDLALGCHLLAQLLNPIRDLKDDKKVY